MKLWKIHNIAAMRLAARRRLPKPIFDYIDGGADDEWSLRRNTEAFSKYELLPDVLVDTTITRTTTKLFGREIARPLMLSPTGLIRTLNMPNAS